MFTQETPARHRSQILIPLQPSPSTIEPALDPDLVATWTRELEQKLELPQLCVSVRLNGAWACVDVRGRDEFDELSKMDSTPTYRRDV
jgi:hypothetical protein